ncbi:hypothetical protein ACFL4O_01525 [bacterium]
MSCLCHNVLLEGRINSWLEYLEIGTKASEEEEFDKHTSTGRPLGRNKFIEGIERKLGIVVKKKKPGPKQKPKDLSVILSVLSL